MNPEALRFAKYFCVGAFIVMLMWAFSDPAKAEDNHIYAGAWSFHADDTYGDGEKYNENNNLVGVQYKRAFVGTFNNSYHDQTYLAGMYFPTSLKNTPVEVSLVAGAMYGYRECYGPGNPGDKAKVCALVMPEFTLNVGRIKPSLIIMSSRVQVLTIKWEF